MASMSKLERLLNLTAVLLDTDRPLTAEAIRTRVEGYPEALASFRRSFERDKEDLRSLGIPLRVERVPGVDPPVDGYRIAPDDYYLPDPGLDSDELAALHLASMAVQVEGLGEREALWKLGGLVDNDAGAVASAVVSMPTNPALVPLFECVTRHQTVRFGYNDERRTVDPWRLEFQRGRWYLMGFDRDRDAERNFRLDRIDGAVEAIGEPGDASLPQRSRPDRVLQPWEIGESEPTMVRLLVDNARVAWARQQFGTDVLVEDHEDGGAVFSVPVVMWDAFRSLVFEFLEHAEVLEPAELRTDIIAHLEDIASGNRGAS
jgi:proteasome accessory factor B